MFKKFSSLKILSFFTLIFFISNSYSPFYGVVFADNTTYYVDASAGNDTNDGLSTGTPWQSLSFVNAQTFLPGDHILLKCGESWGEELIISASGSVGNPITYDAYGTCTDSNKPQITATGATQLRFVGGASDVNIQNIAFASGASTHVSLALAGNNITLSNSQFTGGNTGLILGNGTNITVTHNVFQNVLATSIDAGAGSSANIVENFFNVTLSGTVYGVSLGDFSAGSNVTGNTFSGGLVSLSLKNTANNTISNNTFYNPYTHAITVVEDGNASLGTTNNNTISNNTLLTWEPNSSMIHIDDQSDAIGTLATLSANTYLNVYRGALPLVDVLTNGSPTQSYTKDTIRSIDASAVLFPHFGYKIYTSTGVLNTRAKETFLLVNTTASVSNFSCPSGVLCGQYVKADGSASGWPTPMSVPAYSSKITLWNNSPNILYPPTCELRSLGGGTAGNGQPIDLQWTVTGTLSTTLAYPTSTGYTVYSVPSSGTGQFIPPHNNDHNIYTLTGTNDVGSSVCTVDVTTQNLPPILSPSFATGSEDALVITGQLIATDSPGDELKYYADSFPLLGTLNVFDTGGIEYTPPANFCGQVTFNWNATDNHTTAQNSETATITVLCTNDAPVAVDDTTNGTGGTTQSIDVLANDTDPDNGYPSIETLSVSGMSLPSHGTLSVVNSQFEYTPDISYYGTDSFLYVAVDQSGAVSNTGTVTITVAPGSNFAPEVSSGNTSGNEDTQLVGTFSGSDLNGDALSFSATTLPLHGTLGIAGSDYTYTPNPDYNGSDSFTFVANDGQLDSSGATIQLTVFGVEDFPIANSDTVNVEMNTSSQLDVLLNDVEPDGQSITLTGISTPTNGVASIVANKIQYTPNNGYLGSDSIDYVIEDQNGNLSNTGTVSISVTTTNQFPVADSGAWTTNEDTPLTATLSGSDPESAPLTFILDQNVTHGTLILSSTGEFAYTPNTNYNGSDSFTFHVSDGVLSSSIQTVALTITSVGDAPLAVADTFSGTEDTSVLLTPLANDSDPDLGDTISLLSFTTSGSGSLTQSGDTILYTPTADFCGADNFTYTIQDNTTTPSLPASVTVNVACVNDAPLASLMNLSVLGNIPTQSGNTLTGTLSGSDIDGPSLTFTLVLPGASNGSAMVSSTGYFEYTPNVGYTGSDSFEYMISDGTLSTTGTVNLTVNPNNYNGIPTVFSGAFSLSEDTPLTATLSGSDPESAPLTFILDQNVTHGTLILSSTGEFTYTPNPDYNGSDSFTFHVSDGVNDSPISTGTLTVTAINDTPSPMNDIVSGTEDISLTISPLLNDTDVDGDALTLQSIGTALHGMASLSGNTVTYIPTGNYCGVDTLNYTISDGTLSATGTINIALSCVNDAPTANDDAINATEDMSLLIPVLSNDTEVDTGDTLTVLITTPLATGGTVQPSGTGVLYTPASNFCSPTPITFNYRLRDAAGAYSNTVTGTILSVVCVNDVPTVLNANYFFTSNSGATLTGILSANDVDGDPLTYSLLVTPFTGSMVLSSTGYFSYTIPTNFSGLDTLSYVVTDGQATSASGIIQICIIPPSGNPRPSCAPVLPPVSPSTPTAGPGGGGGGGGGGSSVSIPTIDSYSGVTISGQKNPLLSSLLLSRKPLTGSLITPDISHSLEKLANTIYQSLLTGLTEVINPAKNQHFTATLQAQSIRTYGHSILRVILRNPNLETNEKVSVLNITHGNILLLGKENVMNSRARDALSYILRLFDSRKMTFLQSIKNITRIFL